MSVRFGGRRELDRRHIVVGLLLLTLVAMALAFPLAVLDPNTAAVIVAGLVSIAALLYAKHGETQKEIAQERQRQKAAVYEGFVTQMTCFLSAKWEEASLVPQRNMAHYLASCSQKMIVWGSDEVLSAYLGLKRATKAFLKEPSLENLAEQFWTLEELLLAIRSDLGHKNEGLRRGALLSACQTLTNG